MNATNLIHLETHLQIIGVLLMLLSFIHVIFPSYFRWKEDLCDISLINRQVMYIHTFFVALTVFGMGLLCYISTNDLLYTSLGKTICFGFAIFWTIRLFIQFFGYSSLLWKGKKFETIVHVFFTFFWTYLTLIFWLATLEN